MRLIDLLLPVPCARCGEPPLSPCATCLAMLGEPPNLAVPSGLGTLSALTAYDERSAIFITDAKYRNSRAALRPLARWAVEAIPAEVVAGIDLVTWAPTTRSRRRQRGFDQAEVVARSVGRDLARPVRRLLQRTDGPAQTGRPRTERLLGPGFTCRWAPEGVLLVDDVCTTGATLSAAAQALREGGALQVHGMVLARTPSPDGVDPARIGADRWSSPHR